MSTEDRAHREFIEREEDLGRELAEKYAGQWVGVHAQKVEGSASTLVLLLDSFEPDDLDRVMVFQVPAPARGPGDAIWPDERKAIAHADLYTTGGLIRALQNAIEEANAFDSTPYNLRVLAARAMIVARRREIQNLDPNHPDRSPSMVHKDH